MYKSSTTQLLLELQKETISLYSTQHILSTSQMDTHTHTHTVMGKDQGLCYQTNLISNPVLLLSYLDLEKVNLCKAYLPCL